MIPAAARLFRRGVGQGRLRDESPGLIFLACWAGFIFLFFSASQSKLVPYILPAIPPLAVLIALALAASETEPRIGAWSRAGGAVGSLLLAALAGAMLWVSLGQVKQASAVILPDVAAVAFPATVAALFSAWLWWRGRLRNLAALAIAPALLVIGLVALAPRAAQRLSAAPLAHTLATALRPGDEVYSYRCYPQTLPVYLGRQIGVVEYQGELAFGIGHLPPAERVRRFPTAAELRPLWDSDRTVYLVLEAEKLPAMVRDGLKPGTVLARGEKYLLMINHPLRVQGSLEDS